MEEKTRGLQRFFSVKRKLVKRRDLVGDCGGESARAFFLQGYAEISKIRLFGGRWGDGIGGDALVSATSFLWNHNSFDGSCRGMEGQGGVRLTFAFGETGNSGFGGSGCPKVPPSP